MAHQAMRDLGRERFLFLIQEYEPFFGPMNTNTALLRQAYDFPQFGLFSTAILRDYFAQNHIGLFEEPGGETRSAVFSNAIQRFSPDRARMMRPSRRILFYARPEDHAARNMFEMGIAALVALFADPAIAAAGWTAHGIGSIDVKDRLELAPGQFLRMVPKTNLQDYTAMLPGFDVGLSLMLTPHPSLVPLEMAAAGLSTVTNTFANKTPERLSDDLRQPDRGQTHARRDRRRAENRDRADRRRRREARGRPHVVADGLGRGFPGRHHGQGERLPEPLGSEAGSRLRAQRSVRPERGSGVPARQASMASTIWGKAAA